MNKIGSVLLIGIVCLAAVFYWWQVSRKGAEVLEVLPPTHDKKVIELKKEPEEPVVSYPVPTVEEDESNDSEGQTIALPALVDSDDAIQEELSRLFSGERLASLFLFEQFVRHVVVTIDNLPAKKLPKRFSVNQKLPGKFMVSEGPNEESFELANENSERYAGFVDFAEQVPVNELVKVYLRFYPLFQEAYEELGYPERYFNDRLVEVIDHLLMTPNIQEPLRLVQPKVFYQFADPELEALSAGQKIMLRIGPENATRVKSMLQNMRNRLTTLALE